MAKTSDIRQKEVINVLNGKRMGTVIDIEFSSDGKIEALRVPGAFKFGEFIKGGPKGIRVPWDKVEKIGEDVILVNFKGSDY